VIAIKTQMQRMPEACSICLYRMGLEWSREFDACVADGARYLIDVRGAAETRPDWCPLVEVDDGNID
jgi:hypothetical protein